MHSFSTNNDTCKSETHKTASASSWSEEDEEMDRKEVYLTTCGKQLLEKDEQERELKLAKNRLRWRRMFL